MKAVITSFSLVLATVSLSVAQTDAPPSSSPAAAPMTAPSSPSPEQLAVDDAIHRQANQIEARNKLEQARGAEQRKDLRTAAKLYDDAWALAEGVGPSADPEMKMAVSGLISVRMQLAVVAEHRGDFNEADVQVSDVLRVDSRNEAALQFKMSNDRMVDLARGKTPSSGAIEAAKAAHEENIQTAQLVQDGKLMFQLGKLDEAELKMNTALDRDPNNQAALYYLSLIKQGRIKQVVDARNVTSMKRMVDVEKGWADNDARKRLPVPNPYAGTNMIHTSSQRQALYEKLNNIQFDKVAFPGLQLSEVIRNLTEQTERRDIDQQGINFILNRAKPVAAAPVSPTGTTFDPATGQPVVAPPAPTEDVDLGTVTISLDPGLKNVRLMDVLEAMVKSSDHPIR